MIRKMQTEDGRRILEIYAQGLATRNATFETQVPTWDDWDRNHHRHSRFVYQGSDGILGWAALSPVSKRAVYRGVAEVSVYVDTRSLGQGIGTALMQALIEGAERHGIWTLYASMFPENVATVKLHHQNGFKKVGVREKIACLDGQWRDTLIMERRSTVVGQTVRQCEQL